MRIVCCVLSLSLLAAAEAAAQPGTLRNIPHAVTWAGTLHRANTPIGEVPECTEVPCQRFDLTVSLPGGVWLNKPGGLQVALRWASDAANLRLFVYRDGQLLAAAPGIIATSQSLLIPEAGNGLYRVYVAYDPDWFDDSVPYEARGEVEYLPKPHPTRLLMPDLVALPQRRVTFETPALDFFEPAPAPGDTCFGSEAAEANAVTCLRFDQVLANHDEGPLHLRFVVPHDPAAPGAGVYQRIFWSDLPGQFDEHRIGDWDFHDVHQHFHYEAFALSRLWQADAAGQRVGNAPVREGRKVGFCIADIEIDNWHGKGDGPRSYHAPECLFPSDSDAANDYLTQGLTPGWSDVYEWYLPGQYIEVSGVADGVYLLETVVDPDGTIRESNETNNCSSILIRLTGVDLPTRSVEMLGPGPACQ